jgi:hypothetical protein
LSQLVTELFSSCLC